MFLTEGQTEKVVPRPAQDAGNACKRKPEANMNLHSMFWSMVYFVFPHDLEVISLSQTSIYIS